MELARTGGDQALWELLIEIRREVAWRIGPVGTREDPPYCLVCRANRQGLMPLVKLDPAYYRCSHCKVAFLLTAYHVDGKKSRETLERKYKGRRP